MTNVPENIREALADAYKLFDVSFLMAGTEEDWKQYWDKANKMIQKYGDDIPLIMLLEGYAKIIESVLLERKTGNKTLTWGADEPYQHPRKEL